MDEVHARAILATMEVIGKMMIGLADTGALPRQFCKETALTAAERLEPIDDSQFLETMADQWRITARFFERAKKTN